MTKRVLANYPSLIILSEQSVEIAVLLFFSTA